jgi:hypothetical protein
VRLVLAHHGHRLLEELSEGAAAYTLQLLKRQGIAVRLGTAVKGIAETSVTLDPGGEIPTRTVFWTAGVAPSPVVGALGVAKDKHGAVIVDEHLMVPEQPGLWALGDCAHVPDGKGGSYAPLAQNAEQQAPVVAHNILATLHGAPLRPFQYHLKGTLASLGRRTAVGEAFGLRFSGLLAWLLWRSVYLSKLPGLDRKVRVGLNWALDFVFPADTVQTIPPEVLHAALRRSNGPTDPSYTLPKIGGPVVPTHGEGEDHPAPAGARPPASAPAAGAPAPSGAGSGQPPAAPSGGASGGQGASSAQGDASAPSGAAGQPPSASPGAAPPPSGSAAAAPPSTPRGDGTPPASAPSAEGPASTTA